MPRQRRLLTQSGHTGDENYGHQACRNSMISAQRNIETKTGGRRETTVDPHYRKPWQNPFAERIIGSIRRECLDHVIVLYERHLKRILSSYFNYYQAFFDLFWRAGSSCHPAPGRWPRSSTRRRKGRISRFLPWPLYPGRATIRSIRDEPQPGLDFEIFTISAQISEEIGESPGSPH